MFDDCLMIVWWLPLLIMIMPDSYVYVWWYVWWLFFHFWVAVDGKIHCQAQQRFFLNLYLILTCLMSPHDNWHFPIIMWKGGLEWKKSLKFNKILTTYYKKSIFLKMCPKFDGLEAFSWFVPFFENLRHHVGTPTRWCP